MRRVLSTTVLAIGLVASAIALPSSASAAPPTRIVDHTAQVFCTAVSEDVEITVAVGRSGLEGTESMVQVSVASTAETIGGGRGSSDWTDGTFRAAIPVLDNDEQPVGEAYFAGEYAAAGEPERTLNRYNAGNVHVVEEHTETVAEASNVVLTYGGITFTDLDCGAWINEGSLFFTNPATVVEFGSQLGYNCAGTNLVNNPLIDGTLDELYVDMWFADVPEANATGFVIPDGGAWQGEFRLHIDDEPVGKVAASATLKRSGKPFHATEGETGMRNHFQVTPYRFTMTIAGPNAPATLDCTLFQVRAKLHYLNIEN